MIYDLRNDVNLYIYNKNIKKSSDLLTGEVEYDDVSETVKNTFTYETIIDYIDRYANETIINYYTQGDSILLESNNFGSSFV